MDFCQFSFEVCDWLGFVWVDSSVYEFSWVGLGWFGWFAMVDVFVGLRIVVGLAGLPFA